MDWSDLVGGIAAKLTVGFLATIVLVVFLRPIRRILVPRLVTLGRKLPPSMVGRLIPVVDNVWPDWRTYAGGSTTRDTTGTEERIRNVSVKGDIKNLVFLGGTYLDIMLEPLKSNLLTPGEFSDLSKVQVSLGGSGVHIAETLYRNNRSRSWLFTRVGGRDPLSRRHRKLIRRQPWRKGVGPRGVHVGRSEQCGVSVHLMQESQAYYTTLTHVGTMRNLGWQEHLPQLQRVLRNGGTLFISGYFRTRLSESLCQYLRELSPRVFIMLDHGRVEVENSAREIQALREAFSAGLIDAYACTTQELRLLAQGFGVIGADSRQPEELLRECRDWLPPLVIARGSNLGSTRYAYYSFKGTIKREEIPRQRPGAVETRRPGDKSTFVAGFLKGLSAQTPNQEMHAILSASLSEAVRLWVRQQRRE